MNVPFRQAVTVISLRSAGILVDLHNEIIKTLV